MPGKKKPTVSLVLGSGGARGLAHIGVIHELQKAGYDIRSISGCSIGALVGGVFAAGKLDEFEKWVRAISKVDILSLMDISWGKEGLIKGDKIINTLVELVGDQKIEDLPISFTAVATDITHEREVWLSSGPLFDAIRASMSLPLFFTPVKHGKAHLIDGGVLNPVPIAPTFRDKTDITIAVHLGGRKDRDRKEEKPAKSDNKSPLHEKISKFISFLKSGEEDEREKKLGSLSVANQAFDTMQSTIARQKLAAYPPDATIEISRNICGTMDFDRAAEIIEIGATETREFLSRQEKHSG
ncbi:patatin-like phospholipase family protein [Emcibacter sp.]|uniref:patatin-like phospholipase family protein n=1 Tax=Emcibacter sp. TaxID=1979954 RepID=UPI002AA69CE3|nr:patatin-like phospholipase family protein [Emcibacter sp.]